MGVVDSKLIGDASWQQINDLSAEFHEDHRFLTYPGYAWFGNTAVGGRHADIRTTRGAKPRWKSIPPGAASKSR
jgi:hypothetical protein